MAKTYKNKALAAAHENISDLYRLGMVDKKTMRKFDAACLAPMPKVTPVITVRSSPAPADSVETSAPSNLGNPLPSL
jgi:hypothetical protein